jgi:glycerol kinase
LADERFIGALDQGTMGTQFMVFDHAARLRGGAYRVRRQVFPRPGWVEHDAVEICQNTRGMIAEALRSADMDSSPAAMASQAGGSP